MTEANVSFAGAMYQECTLVFSGHIVDPPGRPEPRFPRAMEPLAKSKIHEAVKREYQRAVPACGIASAASGGDILFHEVCAELGIRTELFLAFPPDEFIEKYLAPAGEEWVERFVRLADTAKIEVLPMAQRLVEITPSNGDEKLIWKRCNEWMLKTALSTGADVTLIALWDGETSEIGNTGHMVEAAASRGVQTVVLNTREILHSHCAQSAC